MLKKFINLTIVIPTLNSSAYIRQCLNSLEKQNYKNYQIYIADGGSKDDTLKIFKEYNFFYKIQNFNYQIIDIFTYFSFNFIINIMPFKLKIYIYYTLKCYF